MNLKGNLFATVLAALQIMSGTTFTLARQTPFDKLIDKFSNGQVFQAEFQHQYIDSYTKDTVVTRGAIWVGEEKYKVQNKQQTVVVDGVSSRVYDETRNRVIISRYEPEEDDFAPSRFLNGADSTYIVKQQEKIGNEIHITLNSTDPFAVFKKVEITLDQSFTPLKIAARDQAGNLITTTFQSGSFMPNQGNIFVLDYPPDAEMIDMRN